MKLLIITTLLITLSTLVPPCISHRTQHHSSHEQAHRVVLALGKLPSKLRPIEVPMVQESMNGDYKSNSAKNGAFTATGFVSCSSASWLQWDATAPTAEKPRNQEPINIRENNMQQFMTMDYSRPRRRRPIHNQAVSGAP